MIGWGLYLLGFLFVLAIGWDDDLPPRFVGWQRSIVPIAGALWPLLCIIAVLWRLRRKA